MTQTDEVVITEVCPRDGFQSLPEFIGTEEKLNIINGLIGCGFKQMEVSSFVHPKAIPQLKDAEEVFNKMKKNNNVSLRALVPNLKGLERAINSNVDKVKLMLSATDSHSLSNANCRTIEGLENFKPILNRALNSSVKITGSISVAFGCPYEGKVSLDRLLFICEKYGELGVKEISLADTAGMANPVLTKKVIRELTRRFNDFKFTLHLHNTRGMAFANAVAAYEQGVREFDSSAGGLGGCPYSPNASGNISSEDLVHGFEEMGINTGISLNKLIEVSKYIESKFSQHTDSFILKAGTNSDLHLSPRGQNKIGNRY
ncbi:hydroxymethylglutaryl-CoA lyase [Aquibacillus sediminis]|uniref:hydroxymethylglutaryl-CoA lyase n=1 Tax=Aquibacillus sediminis TaxID=2574734 RepID=UPI00110905DE|nr:hydroxymethylglutaryl-CoA lyase [Aquibacillus sediminis]